MRKFISIFTISFQQEFAYKINFIMWRVRNMFQIILTYFLWNSVFADTNTEVFGYNREKILTYVFGIIIIRALVFSARSVDIPGEIADGKLSNYLIRPINYFKYWLTRDLSSKALNLAFSISEFIILAIILKPPLFFQSNLLYILLFLIILLLANYLIFVIRMIVSFVTFWMPELAWGAQFIFMMIITEFLSGAVFPLDIFPDTWQKTINLTPFPYLVFFPLQVYLGQITIVESMQGIMVALFWSLILSIIMKKIWLSGLKIYSSEGR